MRSSAEGADHHEFIVLGSHAKCMWSQHTPTPKYETRRITGKASASLTFKATARRSSTALAPMAMFARVDPCLLNCLPAGCINSSAQHQVIATAINERGHVLHKVMGACADQKWAIAPGAGTEHATSGKRARSAFRWGRASPVTGGICPRGQKQVRIKKFLIVTWAKLTLFINRMLIRIFVRCWG